MVSLVETFDNVRIRLSEMTEEVVQTRSQGD